MLTKIISIILISSFTITNIGYCNDAIYYRNISSSYIANKGLRVPVGFEKGNLVVDNRIQAIIVEPYKEQMHKLMERRIKQIRELCLLDTNEGLSYYNLLDALKEIDRLHLELAREGAWNDISPEARYSYCRLLIYEGKLEEAEEVTLSESEKPKILRAKFSYFLGRKEINRAMIAAEECVLQFPESEEAKSGFFVKELLYNGYLQNASSLSDMVQSQDHRLRGIVFYLDEMSKMSLSEGDALPYAGYYNMRKELGKADGPLSIPDTSKRLIAKKEKFSNLAILTCSVIDSMPWLFSEEAGKALLSSIEPQIDGMFSFSPATSVIDYSDPLFSTNRPAFEAQWRGKLAEALALQDKHDRTLKLLTMSASFNLEPIRLYVRKKVGFILSRGPKEDGIISLSFFETRLLMNISDMRMEEELVFNILSCKKIALRGVREHLLSRALANSSDPSKKSIFVFHFFGITKRVGEAIAIKNKVDLIEFFSTEIPMRDFTEVVNLLQGGSFSSSRLREKGFSGTDIQDAVRKPGSRTIILTLKNNRRIRIKFARRNLYRDKIELIKELLNISLLKGEGCEDEFGTEELLLSARIFSLDELEENIPGLKESITDITLEGLDISSAIIYEVNPEYDSYENEILNGDVEGFQQMTDSAILHMKKIIWLYQRGLCHSSILAYSHYHDDNKFRFSFANTKESHMDFIGKGLMYPNLRRKGILADKGHIGISAAIENGFELDDINGLMDMLWDWFIAWVQAGIVRGLSDQQIINVISAGCKELWQKMPEKFTGLSIEDVVNKNVGYFLSYAKTHDFRYCPDGPHKTWKKGDKTLFKALKIIDSSKREDEIPLSIRLMSWGFKDAMKGSYGTGEIDILFDMLRNIDKALRRRSNHNISKSIQRSI